MRWLLLKDLQILRRSPLQAVLLVVYPILIAVLVGFAVSRMAADEAEILSIAVAASHRGRNLSRDLLLTHLGHLAGRGVRTVFLEVEENNAPARRLYDRAGFAVTGRRERYYRQPGGEQLNALLMRRDLS